MSPLQAEAMARSIMFGPAPKSFLPPEEQLKNIASGYEAAYKQSGAFKQPKSYSNGGAPISTGSQFEILAKRAFNTRR